MAGGLRVVLVGLQTRVSSGRNQDLGREGLATAEKPGTKSQKLGPRALGDGVPAAPDRRSRKPLLIEIEWPPLRLSYVRRSDLQPALALVARLG